jgi:hypothetical protein
VFGALVGGGTVGGVGARVGRTVDGDLVGVSGWERYKAASESRFTTRDNIRQGEKLSTWVDINLSFTRDPFHVVFLLPEVFEATTGPTAQSSPLHWLPMSMVRHAWVWPNWWLC